MARAARIPAPFEPLLTRQLPGGSLILDENLLAIKAAFVSLAGSGSSTFVSGTRRIDTTAPLSGGGPLSSDLTLSLDIDSTLAVLGGALGRAAISGDVVIPASSNSSTIQPHVVSYGKMQQASTVTLLGNPTGGTADVQEITLGTNLSFAGNVLNATGGGLSAIGANSLLGNPTAGSAVPVAISLGATSGVLQYLNGAPDTLPVFTTVAGQVIYGAASGGGLAQSSKMTYDDANPLLLLNNGIGTSTVWVDAGTAGAQGGGFFRAYSTGFPVPSLSQSVAFGNDTGAGSLGITVFGNSTSASGGAGYISLRGGGYDTAAENLLLTNGASSFTTGSVSMPAALGGGGMVKAAITTGMLSIATPGTDYMAAFAWPAATDVLVSSGTGTAPVGDSNFTYDTTAHTLSLLGSAPIAFGTGTQTIGKTSGTLAFQTTGAGSFTFAPNSTPTMSLTTAGAVRINSLTAGGMVSAVAATGQLTIATPGTDYQAPVVWPAASQVPVSAGVAVDPLGDSTFTFDRVAHVMAGGNAIGINGATVPSNTSLMTGLTNTANRDRVQFLVGGGVLGATGTNDNTLFDVNPSATVITAGVTAGIYATQRIRAISYSGAGTSPTETTTLYIDGAPTLGGGVSVTNTPAALHVAGGLTRLDGTLRMPVLAAGGVMYYDPSGGIVGLAGVGGLPAAVSGALPYYVNVTGSTLVTGGAVWLGTSSTAGQGGTALEYVQPFAAITVNLSIRIITNAITSGTLAVQITRNGSSFATITLNNGSSGNMTTGTTSVGSPSASDRWGVLVSGTGTGMTGNMVFSATLTLSPNVF